MKDINVILKLSVRLVASGKIGWINNERECFELIERTAKELNQIKLKLEKYENT